jgi:hypothetical protein
MIQDYYFLEPVSDIRYNLSYKQSVILITYKVSEELKDGVVRVFIEIGLKLSYLEDLNDSVK